MLVNRKIQIDHYIDVSAHILRFLEELREQIQKLQIPYSELKIYLLYLAFGAHILIMPQGRPLTAFYFFFERQLHLQKSKKKKI